MIAAAGFAGLHDGSGVARAQDGGTPTNVNAFGCIRFLGGQRTVPAGSTVVIRSGWSSGTRGAVANFLAAQTTLISVADAEMFDASGMYEQPHPGGEGGWVSFLHHATGITLAHPGDSMRFTFALILDRPVADVFDVDGNGSRDPVLTPAGLNFGGTCTVTAVG